MHRAREETEKGEEEALAGLREKEVEPRVAVESVGAVMVGAVAEMVVMVPG